MIGPAVLPSSVIDSEQLDSPLGAQAVKKSVISTLRPSGRPSTTRWLSTRLTELPGGTLPASSTILSSEPGRAGTRVRPSPRVKRCGAEPRMTV